MTDALLHDPATARVEDWRVRFEQLVAERMRTPFDWGSHDCVLWAADAVLAVSGVDLAAEYRGTYGTDAEAMRLLKRKGGLEVLGDLAGERIRPLAAGVGDVGIVSDETGREMFGVCAGAAWLVATAEGLGAISLDKARVAWRVRRG